MRNYQILFFSLFLFETTCYSQQSCSPEEIKQIEKLVKKTKVCSAKGQCLFELGLCYKNVNDSIYKEKLNKAIQEIKSRYDEPPKHEKNLRLLICGEIYYELKNYSYAENYFEKAFYHLDAESFIQPKYVFIYGKSLQNLNKHQEAIRVFESYKCLVPYDTTVKHYIEESAKKIN